jgi:hypothetical protein
MKLTSASHYQQSLWRLRADETRSLAERVSDPQEKRIVFEIAERCDRLAELVGLVQAATLIASQTAPDFESF